MQYLTTVIILNTVFALYSKRCQQTTKKQAIPLILTSKTKNVCSIVLLLYVLDLYNEKEQIAITFSSTKHTY